MVCCHCCKIAVVGGACCDGKALVIGQAQQRQGVCSSGSATVDVLWQQGIELAEVVGSAAVACP